MLNLHLACSLFMMCINDILRQDNITVKDILKF